jgi:hypothetical protein
MSEPWGPKSFRTYDRPVFFHPSHFPLMSQCLRYDIKPEVARPADKLHGGIFEHGNMASPFSTPSTQTVPHSDAKPIPSTSHPTAHKSVAEQQHESHEHINADLYRTFSPSDVAMWDWKAGMCSY